jgi:hypothetical protein
MTEIDAHDIQFLGRREDGLAARSYSRRPTIGPKLHLMRHLSERSATSCT